MLVNAAIRHKDTQTAEFQTSRNNFINIYALTAMQYTCLSAPTLA